MLRNKPALKYCGLTVILSNPSRFDSMSLLSAGAGTLFNNLLRPQYNSMQCDVRLMEDKNPFLPETKCILLLGQAAMHEYIVETRNNTLNEMRGSPFYYKDIPAIASFFPQDAVDIKNYESELNKESKEFSTDDEDDEDEGDQKSHSGTRRANFAFWLSRDIWKCKQLLASKENKKWPVEQEPSYRIYPSSNEVITVLANNKNNVMFLDLETDYEEQNLLCFAFSFDFGKTVYSVPVLNHEYRYSYSDLPLVIEALVTALNDNIVVAHNGHTFDFFVLAAKYHIPVRRAEDTMLMMRRCFPDIEISLGHCMSYWTYQKFHKDTDSIAYRTHQHLADKLRYCAKDVFGLALIYKAITTYAKTIPGLADSISCANRSIIPYLVCSIQGIRYDQKRVDALKKENDELLIQYNSIIEILIGEKGMETARAAIKGGKKGLLPGSNKQCCNYFHTQLGYPVLFNSPQTGEPSLGKKVMFQLALKHENPVIKFIILYRQVQKEYGALKFRPWKDDKSNILPRRGDQTKDNLLEGLHDMW